MTARQPPAAVREFKDWLQLAASCVTDAVIVLSPNGYRPSDVPHRLTLGDGAPVLLNAVTGTGPTRFGLTVLQAYRIVRIRERGPWKVQTAAYQYAVRDADGREILAYHWHPHIENVTYPHLHVSYGAVRREVGPGVELALRQNVLQPELANAHLPTRRVALEDFLRLLIEQFGVRPARIDWDDVLRRSRESFTSERTWV